MRRNIAVFVMCVAAASFAVMGCSDDTTGPDGGPPPSEVWARSAGGPGGDGGYGVAVDGSGNVVVTGFFVGSATFGGMTLTSVGDEDIFVAKYDATGKVLWAHSAGGAGIDKGYGVAVDGSGNVVVTGLFLGSATFGGTMLTGAGVADVFVAKYDAGGTLLWAHSGGGSVADVGHHVAVDGSGNVVVTGTFQGSATFGGTTLTSAGVIDVFAAKYDAGGTLLWAHSAGGSGSDFGEGVAVDGSGNVVITGQFVGSATFGGTTLTSAGLADVFVAKYDAAGNVLWAHSAGGSGGDAGIGFGVAVDGSGNVVLAGRFLGSATFGGTTLTSAGMNDMFVAKYDAAGTVLWAHSAGGSDGDLGYSVAVDGSGNVIVAGYFQDSATFGGTTLTGAGLNDMFVTKYDATGKVLWAHSAGGAGFDEGLGAAVDGSGNVIVTGYFQDSATFGGTTLTSASPGAWDVFVARMSSSGF